MMKGCVSAEMSDLMFKFTDHKDVTEHFDSFLEYMFSSSAREDARQDGFDVCLGVLSRNMREPYIMRTGDFEERRGALNMYRQEFEKHGCRLDELGCFDVIIDYDQDDSEALDLAVQVLVLTLAEWSNHTGTLVAFSLHLSQNNPQGGYEPVHMHILWDRRREEKVYRDNVLQWYMHEQF